MIRAPALALALAAVLLVSGGCKRADPAPQPEPPKPRKLAAEVAGCAAVREGPVCELGADRRTIRVFVAGEARGLEIVSGDDALEASSGVDVPGGRLVSVAIPGGAEGVEVRSGRATWELRIASATRHDVLDRVKALRRRDLDQAAALMPDPATLEGPLHGIALSLAARLALQKGEGERAEGLFREAMGVHRREGRASDEVLDGMALVWTLLKHGRRFGDARAVLARLGPPLATWDEGRASIGYYAGLVERDAGDLRAALAHLHRAAAASERLGLDGYAGDVRQVSAEILTSIGRADDALAVLGALRRSSDEVGACTRAHVLTNEAWARLMLVEARGAGAARDPTPALERALKHYETDCERPMLVLNARVNLGLAALQRGRYAVAERRVAEAMDTALVPEPRIAAWRTLVRARTLSAIGKRDHALVAFEDLARRARAAAAPEPLWRALVGKARLLSEERETGAAIAALAEADALIDRRLRAIPLGEGRASFLSDRDASARLRVALLVDAGRVEEAAAAARGSRRRAIATLRRLEAVGSLGSQARRRWDAAMAKYREVRAEIDRATANAWTMPADELAALEAERPAREAALKVTLDEAFVALGAQPAPAGVARPPAGELWLVFHPMGEGAWVGIAQGPDSARAVTLSDGVRPESRRLLEPFHAEIEAARRVRILAHGALEPVDFHALPFGDDVLLAHAEVIYGADLGPAPAAPGDAAVLVADPTGDLAGARAEAAQVRPRLGGVRALIGDQATARALRDAVKGASLLHFAGHGELGGAGGWDSALKLAGGARLTPGDILALPSAPRTVVLSGCETGASRRSAVVSVSLANAFLAAGSQTVIATTRPVEDAVARTFAEHLYAGGPEPRYRQALLATRKAHPGRDWSAWRLLER